jgi:hypothetical protein
MWLSSAAFAGLFLGIPTETFYENDDMQRARREMRSEVIGRNVGPNGAGHDEARHGEASGCREGNGKDAQERPKEMGQRNEAEMGCGSSSLIS